tara:strand:- start:65955 stop:66668 length:714 start_codon:yes stop_codon:yes gene_type:complete
MIDAAHIISLIDLTSLNENDTDADIIALCEAAQTVKGPVAAVCVYPKFVTLAKQQLAGSGIQVATVTNFPSGTEPLEDTLALTKQCLADGADEIDVVIPYCNYLGGNTEAVVSLVQQSKQCCGNKKLKVILETGALKDPELIKQVSLDVINAGADFIKTSTGKINTGATLDAAQAMIDAISASGKNVGIKISGGVKTFDHAVAYLQAAQKVLGEDWLNANHFRIGASSLLTNLLQSE